MSVKFTVYDKYGDFYAAKTDGICRTDSLEKKDKMRFVYLYLLQDMFMLSVSIEKQKA